jgi:DNA helicase-2/ATP-dependent DNA helicase PcrA
VGVTRAKDHLFLTACKSRFLWGSARMMRPSRFLKEIPSSFLKKLSLYGNSSLSLEETAGSDEFLVGDTAFHNDFGQGIIRKIYQTSLGLTYDVFFFQTKSERTLVAKYAKLKHV